MDRPDGSRTLQRKATNERIRAAATELLRKRGYAALRVAAVAEAAGVSLGGLLHHFPTKESLVVAVLEHLSERVLDLAREDAAAATSADEVPESIARSATRFYAAPEFLIYLDIFLSARRGTPVGDAALRLLQAQRKATEDLWLPLLLLRGVQADRAQTIVRALWALARGLAISSEPRGPASRDAEAQSLVVAALRDSLFKG